VVRCAVANERPASTLSAGGFLGGNASASRFDAVSVRIPNSNAYNEAGPPPEKAAPHTRAVGPMGSVGDDEVLALSIARGMSGG
jgi:hypothetical protein